MSVATLQRARPVGGYERLRERLFVETELYSLVMLFGEAISEDGIDGHLCVAVGDDGAFTPLFGDSLWLVDADDRQIVPAGSVTEPNRSMLFFCRAPIPASARLRGFATLYASRASTLRELLPETVTGCALSLTERRVLSHLLTGMPAIDVGIALDVSTAAVQLHVGRAVDTLGTSDAAEAVALAARRGWLVGLPNDLCFLSDSKVS